jgi:mannosyl-oligosaccharide alpha-1,2-mannosidase
MVSLQDLYARIRYARGPGSWRNCVLLAVAFGFLITLYRTYMLPSRPWLIHPEEEDEFDVPGRHVNWAARANAVKQAFVHAYHGYETYAFPEDELLPLTNSSKTM